LPPQLRTHEKDRASAHEDGAAAGLKANVPLLRAGFPSEPDPRKNKPAKMTEFVGGLRSASAELLFICSSMFINTAAVLRFSC
jgi:hypothetical protein